MTQTTNSNNRWAAGLQRLAHRLHTTLNPYASRQEEQATAVLDTPSAQDMLDAIREELKTETFAIPIFPTIAQRVLAKVNDPRVEVADIARLIESDSALAAQVLGVSNSAAFSGGTPIVTVQRAIAQLGLHRVRSLLFAVMRRNMFPRSQHRPHHQAYFHEALATAAAAEALGLAIKVDVGTEQRFLYGILHNVGKPCMLNLISHMQSRHQLPRTLDAETTQALVALTYEECGALLAQRWKLPTDFSDVICYHKVPEQLDATYRNGALLTHMAIAVCSTWGIGYMRDPLNIVFNSPHAAQLGLTPADFDHAAQSTLERYTTLKDALS
ncbi:MAG: HDOD domain-containing protein [Myxococcota bacterium]